MTAKSHENPTLFLFVIHLGAEDDDADDVECRHETGEGAEVPDDVFAQRKTIQMVLAIQEIVAARPGRIALNGAHVLHYLLYLRW